MKPLIPFILLLMCSCSKKESVIRYGNAFTDSELFLNEAIRDSLLQFIDDTWDSYVYGPYTGIRFFENDGDTVVVFSEAVMGHPNEVRTFKIGDHLCGIVPGRGISNPYFAFNEKFLTSAAEEYEAIARQRQILSFQRYARENKFAHKCYIFRDGELIPYSYSQYWR